MARPACDKKSPQGQAEGGGLESTRQGHSTPKYSTNPPVCTQFTTAGDTYILLASGNQAELQAALRALIGGMNE